LIALGAAATVVAGLALATLFVLDVLSSGGATAAPPLVGEMGEPNVAEPTTPVADGDDERTEGTKIPEAESGPTTEEGDEDLRATLVAAMEDVASAVTGAEGDEAPIAAESPPTATGSVNPWEGPVPRTLASIRRSLRGDRRMSPAAHRRLRSYAERNRDDARVFLLLGHGYVSRGWRPDAVERYQRAYELDANARNDPQMKQNLARLAAHGNVGPSAQRLLRAVYGAETAAIVDEALSSGDLARDEEARLRAFRSTLR
jgi:hypothetical protein